MYLFYNFCIVFVQSLTVPFLFSIKKVLFGTIYVKKI